MKHFVRYHNTDEMGYWCDEVKNPFYVVANRSTSYLRAGTVWLIAGTGEQSKNRKSYFLCSSFVVDEAGPTESGAFSFYAKGSTGKTFRPPVQLDALPWFPAFRRSQGNFGIGVSEIKPEYVAELERMTEHQGRW